MAITSKITEHVTAVMKKFEISRELPKCDTERANAIQKVAR